MGINHSFLAPTALRFSQGSWVELFPLIAGTRVCAVTGVHTWERLGISDQIVQLAATYDIELLRIPVRREPTCGDADAAAALARAYKSTHIVGFGGGSALDLAKAVAGLSVNDGQAVEYVEGQAQPPRRFAQAPLPVYAVPTTAGTGSEVTKNSVLQVESQGVKRSLRDDRLTPRMAWIDASFSAAAPAPLRIATAFDAATHLMESYCSTKASWMTDALATAALTKLMPALGRLVDGAEQPVDAESIAWAATMGGLCLAHAGLGAAHGLVAPLGGLHPHIAHGAALACLWPASLQVTLAANPPVEVRQRLAHLAEWMQVADVPTAIATLNRWRRQAQLRSLRGMGVTDFAPIVAAPSGSLKTHPVVLSTAQLTHILALASED